MGRLNLYLSSMQCLSYMFYLDNDIDGPALAMLPQDFEEFCHLIPQSGIRIKLKSLINKYSFDSGSSIVS